MTIKRAIAGWLCPDMKRDAERYHWLSGELNDGWRWLGEFPLVAAFIERLRKSEINHFRSLAELPVENKWHWNIAEFREQLRRTPATPEKQP